MQAIYGSHGDSPRVVLAPKDVEDCFYLAIEAGRIAREFGTALVAPVLTAHPTEVMRKSMLDHRNRIAQLLKLRDAGKHETPDGDLLEPAIVRQIALLWQTRALRRDRLYVTDEVESALAYMREVFLPVLPALYARWERVLRHRPRSFLRLGSWIGGDRDGNPNVTAESLGQALRRAGATVLESYLTQVDALAAELSAAGSVLHDRVWRMPVWEDYQELLDSPVADIANIDVSKVLSSFESSFTLWGTGAGRAAWAASSWMTATRATGRLTSR